MVRVRVSSRHTQAKRTRSAHPGRARTHAQAKRTASAQSAHAHTTMRARCGALDIELTRAHLASAVGLPRAPVRGPRAQPGPPAAPSAGQRRSAASRRAAGGGAAGGGRAAAREQLGRRSGRQRRRGGGRRGGGGGGGGGCGRASAFGGPRAAWPLAAARCERRRRRVGRAHA
eukprot:scaffold118310_cov66-Phaeocystis_antarctica.AAC.9